MKRELLFPALGLSFILVFIIIWEAAVGNKMGIENQKILPVTWTFSRIEHCDKESSSVTWIPDVSDSQESKFSLPIPVEQHSGSSLGWE